MCNYEFDPLVGKKAADLTEQAYRSGVHQALVMLQYCLEESGQPIEVILPMAIEKAEKVRRSKRVHSSLLHTLFGEIQRNFKKGI